MVCPDCQNKRTGSQNNALHLLFSQISKECEEKGIDMREVVRNEVPIPCTPENIKWMWKLLQQAMFGIKSTTQLKKTGDIERVYDVFNKIWAERTNGEILLPSWPSIETLTEQNATNITKR